MLRMRLKRVGKKNQPSFRVIVTDGSKGPKTGRVVENIGFYNPKTKEKVLNAERASHWMGVGAQPSDTVHNMLVDAGVVKTKKRNALPRKTPIVKEQEASVEEAETSATQKVEGGEAPAETEVAKESEETPTETVEDPVTAEEKPVAEETPSEEDPDRADESSNGDSTSDGTGKA